MLNVCDGFRGQRHQQVCYDGIDCPACEALDAALEAEESLRQANTRLEQFDKEMDALRNRVAIAEAPYATV